MPLYQSKRKGQLPDYPKNHKVGMRVPNGGSNCAKCEYLDDDDKSCVQPDFVKWNGAERIPAPVDSYCCDFFNVQKA